MNDEIKSDMKFEETKTDKRSSLRAVFSRETGGDYIQISIIGDPNVYKGKATPDDIRRFAKEWDAYQAGKDELVVEGTPLTDVPGITKEISRQYVAKGVRTAEELAALNDLACQKIGHGTLSARKAAQNMLAASRVAELEELLKTKTKKSKAA